MRAVVRPSRGCAWVLILSASICAAAVAHAAPPVDEATRAAAREIGYEGVAAFERGDYALAHERLDKAYTILHAPSLGLWSARALVKVGKLVEARERYLEVTRLPTSVGHEAVQAQARTDAAAEEAALAPRIPALIVRVTSATAAPVTVTIDGVPLVAALWGESRPINPGHHSIRASTDQDSAEETVALAEGEQKVVVLALARAVAWAEDKPEAAVAPLTPAPAPQQDLQTATPRSHGVAWAALGLGGAGLAVGAVAGALALSARDQLRNNPSCVGTVCSDPQTANDVEHYNRLRVVSGAGVIAGAGFAAIGTALMLFWRPSTSGNQASPGLSLSVSPGGAAVCGGF